MNDASLRALLIRLLDWQDAHIHIDDAVEGIATDFQGVRPEGTPYSAWELLEHMRLAQWDILDFCRNPEYEEQKWPDDYWPDEPAPESEAAWNECLASFRADRESLKVLAKDSDLELFAEIPHGTGQTYIRELLLVADHAACSGSGPADSGRRGRGRLLAYAAWHTRGAENGRGRSCWTRTGEEIRAAKDIALNGKESGLIDYWKFDEKEMVLVSDSSPNQTHGELRGDAVACRIKNPLSPMPKRLSDQRL